MFKKWNFGIFREQILLCWWSSCNTDLSILCFQDINSVVAAVFMIVVSVLALIPETTIYTVLEVSGGSFQFLLQGLIRIQIYLK